MSKLARALALAAMLAAMNLAGVTAVAHAQPAEHTTIQPTSQRPSDGDATLQRLLARERSSIPNGDPAQALSTGPVQPAEPSGQPGWFTPALTVLAAVLALVAGVAVMAARRASHSQRAGQAA
ncbi:MAG TPA: hypothetical protein VFD04_02310 [Actinomycetes bacterium]|jgi:hypothetical protein|nr:hypothetical protein [Actinomycetes bacterium]